MWIFGKSKKELYIEALEIEASRLNSLEDITNSYPIGKEFKYLGESVWVTEVKLHTVERRLHYMSDGSYHIAKSGITLEYWNTLKELRHTCLSFKEATQLLKEI
jgi:hypothetical protein